MREMSRMKRQMTSVFGLVPPPLPSLPRWKAELVDLGTGPHTNMQRPLSSGRIVIRASHGSIGTLVHVSRQEELVTLWVHFISEKVDPSLDEGDPVRQRRRRDNTNVVDTPLSVSVCMRESGLILHCQLDLNRSQSPSKYVLVTDLFLKSNEHILVTCSQALEGRLMLTGVAHGFQEVQNDPA